MPAITTRTYNTVILICCWLQYFCSSTRNTQLSISGKKRGKDDEKKVFTMKQYRQRSPAGEVISLLASEMHKSKLVCTDFLMHHSPCRL